MMRRSSSSHTDHRNGRTRPGKEEQRQTDKERRKDWGLLAYYVAGGIEQRSHEERRNQPETVSPPEKRTGGERRKVINTKYLNCGKVIDQRSAARRYHDRIDLSTVEREKYNRLGPGWLE